MSTAPLPPYLRRLKQPFEFDYSAADRISMQLTSIQQLTEMIEQTLNYITETNHALPHRDQLLSALRNEIEIIGYARVSSTSVMQF